MENNIQYKTIYPKIDVYSNLIPDIKELIETMKESERSSNGKYYLRQWEQWSIFGKYSQQKHEDSEPREFGEMYDKEKKLSDSVYQAYNIAINDYIRRNEIVLPESAHLMSSSFSKYKKDLDVLENNLSMNYHTDFKNEEKDFPGPKFFLTCTTYINDDYDGGEIEFFIDNKFISHKPKAGDILVFPSTPPYFHGVKTITNGEKFFVRNFVMYPSEGSKDWLMGQKLYGVREWLKMEEKRIKKEMPLGMLYFENGKQISFEEKMKINENNNSRQ